MTEGTDRTEKSGRGRKVALVTLGIIVAVFVLFTWVFPWITEMGLSPALD